MTKLFVLVACTFGLVAGCKSGCDGPAPTETAAPAAAPQVAKPSNVIRALFLKLKSRTGDSVAGTVTFTETGGAVTIVAEIAGLAPGTYGFRVHEKGDCSAKDFSSAGGHFNPGGMDHGGPGAASHAGDLGNVAVGDDGRANYRAGSNRIALSGGDTSIIGRALIVHADADDLTSQQSGVAGARVACAVIEPQHHH